MNHAWQLQEAKNRLSEVVNEAKYHGPQIITRHGIETAVVVSVDDFRKLTKSNQNIVDFILSSPWNGVELKIERNKDVPRETDF